MKMITAERVTAFIFWLGFISFLSTSIPHLAWVYEQYGWNDLMSYGVAISVDVLIAWLSWTCARGKVVERGLVILFILLLTGISYYCNYLFDMAHNPAALINVWSIQLLFGWTAGDITPKLISALPIFSLAYTFMLAKLSSVTIDTDQLEKVLQNKMEVKKLREKYPVSDPSLEKILDAGKRVSKLFSKKHPIESQTSNQMDVREQSKLESENGQKDNLEGASSGSTTGRSMSIEEASKLLQCEVRHIRKLVSEKKLKAPNGSTQFVTTASVNALSEKKQKRVSDPLLHVVN